MKTILAIAAAACAFVCQPAIAAVTFHSDQASFDAATTGAKVTDGFETAPAYAFTDYSAGYVGKDFSITDKIGQLYNADPLINPTIYNWGSGDVMLFGRNSTATFTFASAVTAFSIDLMSIANSAVTITVAGNSFRRAVATDVNPNRTFFGLTSDTGITGFTLTAAGGYGEFDNLTLTSARAVSAAVPEPATWAMMLIGFGGIGVAMRRRKDKVAMRPAYAA